MRAQGIEIQNTERFNKNLLGNIDKFVLIICESGKGLWGCYFSAQNDLMDHGAEIGGKGGMAQTFKT